MMVEVPPVPILCMSYRDLKDNNSSAMVLIGKGWVVLLVLKSFPCGTLHIFPHVCFQHVSWRKLMTWVLLHFQNATTHSCNYKKRQYGKASPCWILGTKQHQYIGGRSPRRASPLLLTCLEVSFDLALTYLCTYIALSCRERNSIEMNFAYRWMEENLFCLIWSKGLIKIMGVYTVLCFAGGHYKLGLWYPWREKKGCSFIFHPLDLWLW